MGLIGPNGAGKTTLLNVLSGFVSPTSRASVSLGDAELTRKPAYARVGHGFGRTFQHAELFDELTVRETLEMIAGLHRRCGPYEAGREPAMAVKAIIGTLGLSEFADAYPKTLPFGVQKVADIGRMIAAGANVVAFDEPFSGLDAPEMRRLRGIIASLRQAGVSILIIDHAVNEIFDLADEVVVLDFGRVIAAGPPGEVRNDPDVRRAYFGTVDVPESQRATP